MGMMRFSVILKQRWEFFVLKRLFGDQGQENEYVTFIQV